MSSSASTVPNPADLLPFPQKPISPSSLAPPLAGPSSHLNHPSQPQQQQQQQQQLLPPPPQQQPTPPSTTISQTPAATQAAHKRTYQACIPCRLRKVRCDLGSVEAPHDPPCVRCRRESKDCYFSATRRKSRVGNLSPASTRGRGASLLARGVRRASEVDSIDPAYDGVDSDSTSVVTPSSSTISYGGVRKRQRIDSTASSEGPQETAVHGYTYPSARDYDDSKLRSPLTHSSSHFDRNHEDAQTNTTASTLLQREVYNSHDALQLLFEAVGASTPVATGSDGKTASIDGGDARRGSRADSEPRIIFPGDHDHPSINSGVESGIMGPSPRRQFLHQIHRNSPLSPLASRDGPMRHPTGGLPKLAEHASLMGRATTSGSNGSRTSDIDRAIKAWGNSQFVRDGWFTAREAISYVEYFNENMQTLSPILSSSPELSEHPDLLTSEPFLMTTIITIASRYKTLDGQGGTSRSYYIHEMLWKELKRGFERLLWGGAPAPNTPERGSASGRGTKGLRTIGTVEALIVLTEWHVRSAHFPMELGGDSWGIANPVVDDEGGMRNSMFGNGRNAEKIGDMLEPVRRSDTMSWMLLGNALSLSYELGVFDQESKTLEDDAMYRHRCKRLQRKLLVYIMQLSSRLGFTPMVPLEICNLDAYAHLRQGSSTWNTTTEMNDVVYDYWAELSLLMKKGASLLFPSRSETKDIIRQGKYGELLRSCLPEMRDWKDRFERLGLPTPIHNILTLEYEHLRIFHNSLALQAVVERCTSTTAANPKQPPSHSFAALMQMYSGDVEFIKELVDAARCMLTTVVEKMMPANELRHAPVRIYLRILSAAMFLLKTFALGAKEDDITVSLELMHSTTEALRAAAVDDVHLAWRFADLLETLTKRIQRRFVRMHRNGAETPIHGHHGANTPQPQTPMANPPHHQQQHHQQQQQPQQQQQQQHTQHHRPMDLSKLIDPIHPTSSGPPGMAIQSLSSPNSSSMHSHYMHYSQPGTPSSQQAHVDFFYSPNEPQFDDWLAIPIDPILDTQYGDKNNVVYQNGLGIGVGLGVEVDGRGVDLLDVLLGMGEG